MRALLTWLKFAWHNTLRNRRRSLVTVSIVALGAAGMLLAGGFALFSPSGGKERKDEKIIDLVDPA